MSAKTTFFAAAISLTLGGCCCPPNPCCQVGAPAYAPAYSPAVMAPGLPAAMCAPLTAAFTCNVPQTPVYQPVSMSLTNANCPPQPLRQQRNLRKNRCAVPDYYPPVKPQRYRPIKQRKTTIKDVFRDRIVWGKPKYKEARYPGVVQDPPRKCNCEKCRQKRHSCSLCQDCNDSCRDAGSCGENNCAVPSQIWADEGCVTEMQVQQPWEVCGEGCMDYDMLTATTVSQPVDATPVDSDDDARQFNAPQSHSANHVPPPAPIPPPEEEPLDSDEVPQRLDPPPVDVTTPADEAAETRAAADPAADPAAEPAVDPPEVIAPPEAEQTDGIEQTGFEEVPVLDFSLLEAADGHGKDHEQSGLMRPTSVTHRQIQ